MNEYLKETKMLSFGAVELSDLIDTVGEIFHRTNSLNDFSFH